MFSKRQFFSLLFFILMIVSQNAAANNQLTISMEDGPFTADEMYTIEKYLYNNITTNEHVVTKESEGQVIRSIPGAVLASPSNKGLGLSQDYQFHWVRDAAITMYEVVLLYAHESKSEKERLKTYLINYINFERKVQSQTSNPGEETLGQPKYNIDGTIWEGEWMRPQNDGPALRAITLTAIANTFLQEGQETTLVRDVILGMIKTDLDYVTSHWQNKSYDLWEEVNDQDHFFTKMVQRKGLIDGSLLLRKFGDEQRADVYFNTASQITTSLEKHWNANLGYFAETVHQQYFKGGGLDTSIILGVLYGNLKDPNDAFAVNNERVMSSIYFIRNAFSGLYRLNIENHNAPPLLGRYPSDVYDGDQFDYGNPWIATTTALAQYYYTLADTYLKLAKIAITPTNILLFQQINPELVDKPQMISMVGNPVKFFAIINGLMTEGDNLLRNVKQYSVCYNDSCMHFSEQIDRSSGKQVSAKDLTWNYASLLLAMQARYISN